MYSLFQITTSYVTLDKLLNLFVTAPPQSSGSEHRTYMVRLLRGEAEFTLGSTGRGDSFDKEERGQYTNSSAYLWVSQGSMFIPA